MIRPIQQLFDCNHWLPSSILGSVPLITIAPFLRQMRDHIVAAVLFFAFLISSACIYAALAVPETVDQITLV